MKLHDSKVYFFISLFSSFCLFSGQKEIETTAIPCIDLLRSVGHNDESIEKLKEGSFFANTEQKQATEALLRLALLQLPELQQLILEYYVHSDLLLSLHGCCKESKEWFDLKKHAEEKIKRFYFTADRTITLLCDIKNRVDRGKLGVWNGGIRKDLIERSIEYLLEDPLWGGLILPRDPVLKHVLKIYELKKSTTLIGIYDKNNVCCNFIPPLECVVFSGKLLSDKKFTNGYLKVCFNENVLEQLTKFINDVKEMRTLVFQLPHGPHNMYLKENNLNIFEKLFITLQATKNYIHAVAFKNEFDSNFLKKYGKELGDRFRFLGIPFFIPSSSNLLKEINTTTYSLDLERHVKAERFDFSDYLKNNTPISFSSTQEVQQFLVFWFWERLNQEGMSTVNNPGDRGVRIKKNLYNSLCDSILQHFCIWEKEKNFTMLYAIARRMYQYDHFIKSKEDYWDYFLQEGKSRKFLKISSDFFIKTLQGLIFYLPKFSKKKDYYMCLVCTFLQKRKELIDLYFDLIGKNIQKSNLYSGLQTRRIIEFFNKLFLSNASYRLNNKFFLCNKFYRCNDCLLSFMLHPSFKTLVDLSYEPELKFINTVSLKEAVKIVEPIREYLTGLQSKLLQQQNTSTFVMHKIKKDWDKLCGKKSVQTDEVKNLFQEKIFETIFDKDDLSRNDMMRPLKKYE